MKCKYFDATIYRNRVCQPTNRPTRVGIHFEPAPSLSLDDLRELIDWLCELEAEMATAIASEPERIAMLNADQWINK